MRSTGARVALGVLMVGILAASIVVLSGTGHRPAEVHLTAYFDNSNGVFPGDEVHILGVPVGKIDSITPEPTRAKITFWVDTKYPVPAGADAVIMEQSLVSARVIQLTPAYTGGPELADGAVIPQSHTMVPVEWDDLREQLQKLTAAMQPTTPGGVSPAGAFINTTADNLRGQGAQLRDGIIVLAQTISALGDHSGDISSSIKNLSTLVSGLRGSTDLMEHLNGNLASATTLLANDPHEIAQAVTDLNTAVTDVSGFIADNRDTLGGTADKLTALSSTLVESLGDIKQTLHVGAPALDNFLDIYQPAHSTITGSLAANNFANPIQFLCAAIQAASRLGADQAAKLCVQYLAPIVKNRVYNFPPLGENLIVGATARPNEITYSEDWMRPDYRPSPPAASPPPADPAQGAPAPPPEAAPLPAEAPGPTKDLEGLMLPQGGG